MNSEEVRNKLTNWFENGTRLELTTVLSALEIYGVVTISRSDGELLELRSIDGGIIFVLHSGHKLLFYLEGENLTIDVTGDLGPRIKLAPYVAR
jgi:hypothetical protein